MTWLERIVEAYEALGGQSDYSTLYKEVGRRGGRALTSAEEAGVRKEIERHSSDSLNWKPGTPDLFYSVNGIGSGVWGLRRHKTVK